MEGRIDHPLNSNFQAQDRTGLRALAMPGVASWQVGSQWARPPRGLEAQQSLVGASPAGSLHATLALSLELVPAFFLSDISLGAGRGLSLSPSPSPLKKVKTKNKQE